MALVNHQRELWLGQIRVWPQDAILTCRPGVGSSGPMSYAIYQKQGPVAWLTINRPEVMNALHREANIEMTELVDSFKQDDEARVLVLTGAGERAFAEKRNPVWKGR
jgi:Enoyl-CoA hydratase/isomerase